MKKEELLELYKQWSHDTCFLSYHDTQHPAYLKLKEAGPEIIPWVLERLRDTLGRDKGEAMDRDNSPWLSTCLLADLTNSECFEGFSNEYAGQLPRIRLHLLKWGASKGY